MAFIPTKNVEETPKKTSESVVEDILANDISTPTGIRFVMTGFLNPKMKVQIRILVLTFFQRLPTVSSAVEQIREVLLRHFDLLELLVCACARVILKSLSYIVHQCILQASHPWCRWKTFETQ